MDNFYGAVTVYFAFIFQLFTMTVTALWTRSTNNQKKQPAIEKQDKADITINIWPLALRLLSFGVQNR